MSLTIDGGGSCGDAHSFCILAASSSGAASHWQLHSLSLSFSLFVAAYYYLLISGASLSEFVQPLPISHYSSRDAKPPCWTQSAFFFFFFSLVANCLWWWTLLSELSLGKLFLWLPNHSGGCSSSSITFGSCRHLEPLQYYGWSRCCWTRTTTAVICFPLTASFYCNFLPAFPLLL